MTDLGWSAVTMAAHVAIVLAIATLIFNAAVSALVAGSITITPAMRWAICAAASALIVERIYYVLARLLVNTSYDLWSKHPAPEILAGIVAASIAWCGAAMLTSFMRGPVLAGLIATQAGTLVAVFCLVSWVFR